MTPSRSGGASHPENDRRGAPEGRTTILVVEDEESYQEALLAGLSREGYHVQLASDGLEALDQFVNNRPDLVVLDLLLPSMPGIEVCRRMPRLGSRPDHHRLSARFRVRHRPRVRDRCRGLHRQALSSPRARGAHPIRSPTNVIAVAAINANWFGGAERRRVHCRRPVRCELRSPRGVERRPGHPSLPAGVRPPRCACVTTRAGANARRVDRQAVVGPRSLRYQNVRHPRQKAPNQA